MRRFAWSPLVLGAALAACNTIPAVDEAQKLIAQGRTEEGILQLEQAARDNPNSAQAFSTYMAARDAYVIELVRQGDAARLFGDTAAAEQLFQRALRVDPGSSIARNGLDALVRDRRSIVLAAQAEEAFKAGRFAEAEAKAKAALADNPGNRAARTVLRQVADRQAQAQVAPPQLTAALGKPITLEFRDANIRSVFEAISRSLGINFVLDRDVRQDLRVTIFVRNTNLDDVLKILLVSNQLDRKVINENSLLIYPNTPAKQKDYQALAVRGFYLTNADVKQTAAMIRAIVKTRDLYIDEKLNLLVMRDTPDAIRLAEHLVATQDLGEPEVMLQVEVLEVASSKLQEIGLRYPDAIRYGLMPMAVDTGTGGGTGTTTSTALPPFINLRDTSGWTLFTTNPLVVLTLRQTDGATNLLANPRIRVKNRDKAKIHIGEKVPVITTTSTANVGVSSSVSYLDTGLKLDVEPNIYLDDEVAIKVALEVSNIIEQLNISGTLAYRLGTRNTATTLRLRDGETQVLAGLISDEDRRTANKVPGLSELPILGRLFSSNLDTRNKTDIVLLITPRVVRTLARPEGTPAEFAAGTDANPGAPALQLRPTAAQSLSLAPGAGAAAAAPAAPAPPQVARAAPGQAVNLLWAAPSQAVAGREFTISVGIPPGAEARAARLEIAYDPKVLQALGGAPLGEGRVGVDVQGPVAAGASAAPTELRFRVLATAPGTTQLRVEGAGGIDFGGNPVGVVTPGTHTITVVAQ
ncbi:MAG TPA: secretin N-terminal domain-containing protein [Burkholderiales bacterium]|nr:secretin N-terminal domain-containing protein [Burkholderiales bacterium]